MKQLELEDYVKLLEEKRKLSVKSSGDFTFTARYYPETLFVVTSSGGMVRTDQDEPDFLEHYNPFGPGSIIDFGGMMSGIVYGTGHRP